MTCVDASPVAEIFYPCKLRSRKQYRRFTGNVHGIHVPWLAHTASTSFLRDAVLSQKRHSRRCRGITYPRFRTNASPSLLCCGERSIPQATSDQRQLTRGPLSAAGCIAYPRTIRTIRFGDQRRLHRGYAPGSKAFGRSRSSTKTLPRYRVHGILSRNKSTLLGASRTLPIPYQLGRRLHHTPVRSVQRPVPSAPPLQGA